MKLYRSEFESLYNIVGTATHYGLFTVRRSNPGGVCFPHQSKTALEPTQPPIHAHRISFPKVKRQENGVDYAPHLALRLKKE